MYIVIMVYRVSSTGGGGGGGGQGGKLPPQEFHVYE